MTDPDDKTLIRGSAGDDTIEMTSISRDEIRKTVQLTDGSGDGPVESEGPTFGSGKLDDDYTIIDKIGDGGMGIVYLARDKRLNRNVAVKRLLKNSQLTQTLHDRFLQEAKAIAALNHIHIVHVYALGEDEEGPYIVMEYVPGFGGVRDGDLPAAPVTLDDR